MGDTSPGDLFGSFGLAGSEPGDLLAAGAAGDEEDVGAVLDGERVVVDLDADGLAGVLNADVDALLGEHDGARQDTRRSTRSSSAAGAALVWRPGSRG